MNHGRDPSTPNLERSCGVIPFRRLAGGGGIQFLVVHSALVRNPEAAWEFPKGSPNPGETDIETALRELREETTVTQIRVLPDFRDQVRYTYRREGREIEKTVVFFTGEVLDWTGIPDAAPTNEHGPHPRIGQWHKWGTEAQTHRLLFHAGMRNLLDRTARFIYEFDRLERSRPVSVLPAP
jgi:bis(5'-nucleosidyl)-tetraphosphatase